MNTKTKRSTTQIIITSFNNRYNFINLKIVREYDRATGKCKKEVRTQISNRLDGTYYLTSVNNFDSEGRLIESTQTSHNDLLGDELQYAAQIRYDSNGDYSSIKQYGKELLTEGMTLEETIKIVNTLMDDIYKYHNWLQ